MVKLPNKSIAFISAIVISGVTSNFILNKAMLFFNSTLFGTNDPILGHDIGYYMFQKPFIELIILIGLLLKNSGFFSSCLIISKCILLFVFLPRNLLLSLSPFFL